MLFAKKNTSEKPKPPSALRQAFGALMDPHIGTTVRPMRESMGIFLNLLALVFAAFDMFPRNHPALTGAPGARLRLGEILETAWGNIRLTKEGIPQALLFFAVIASLVFSTLAVAVFAFSLFVGHARAAVPPVTNSCGTAGYFTPCDSVNDIALNWIKYIFTKDYTMTNYLDQYGQVVPQSQAIQTALISALAFYSYAILIVAAIILFYHLIVMVVETAQTGVPLGKKERQFWAPIRLVVAIGLLVPISGGLNCGQYIVIQVATWGSNMASQAWSVFVTALAREDYSVNTATAPYARKAVYDTVMMEACMFAYNQFAGGSCSTIQNNLDTVPDGMTPMVTANVPNHPGGVPCMVDDIRKEINNDGAHYGDEFFYDFNVNDSTVSRVPLKDLGMCGHYIYPPTPTGSDSITTTFQAGIADARDTTYSELKDDKIKPWVAQNMAHFLPPELGCTGCDGNEGADLTGSFDTLVADYQSALQNQIKGLTNGGDASTSPGGVSFQTAMADIATKSSSQGWVSAGAWLNTIARAQSAMMDVDLIVPGTQGPLLGPIEHETTRDDIMQKTINAVKKFQLKLQKVQTGPTTAGAASQASTSDARLLAAAGIAEEGSTGSKEHLMDKLFAFVDWVAQWDGVWNSLCPGIEGIVNVSNCIATANTTLKNNFTIGVQFTGSNPFAQIAYFGHAQLRAAYDLFDFFLQFLVAIGLVQMGATTGQAGLRGFTSLLPWGGAALDAVGSLLPSTLGAAAGGAKEAVGTVIGVFATMFFTTGMMLAFFLPLIPFFRFMFNVLTWIVALLEAVIAVPLVALAHLNPDGEGLPGASAKSAYFFVFHIFLRPILMVFGLVLGIVIFYLAASYLNLLYMQAVVGTGGIAHGHLLLSRFVYSFLYVFILFLAANSSFHMIDWLPDNALKWMGQQGLHWQKMGDPDQLQQPFLLISGYAGQQLIGGMKGMDAAGAFASQQALRGQLGNTIEQHGGQLKQDLNKFTENVAGPGNVDPRVTSGIDAGVDKITKAAADIRDGRPVADVLRDLGILPGSGAGGAGDPGPRGPAPPAAGGDPGARGPAPHR